MLRLACWTAPVKASTNVIQLNVPADLETLVNERLPSGNYTNAEDVLRRALATQMLRKVGLMSARHSPRIEEGYLQAERGELNSGEQVRLEVQAMKDDWRLSNR